MKDLSQQDRDDLAKAINKLVASGKKRKIAEVEAIQAMLEEAEEELEEIVESIKSSSAYQSLKKPRQRPDDEAVHNGNPKRNQETGE